MKKIDISVALKNFQGETMEQGGEDITLKDILLTYLTNAHMMPLKKDDNAILYGVGSKVGTAKKTITLEQKEYDALKRMVDCGEVEAQGKKSSIFSITISEQVKNLINKA